MNRYLAGALAGLVAAVPMTATMVILHRRLPKPLRYELPPRQITGRVAEGLGRADRSMPEYALTWSSLAAHFGYGALTGALYPLVARRVGPGPVPGALYGIAVWAASYMGWVPAAGILQPATRQPAPRRRLMLTAHLVWGATTALVSSRLLHREHFPQAAASKAAGRRLREALSGFSHVAVPAGARPKRDQAGRLLP